MTTILPQQRGACKSGISRSICFNASISSFYQSWGTWRRREGVLSATWFYPLCCIDLTHVTPGVEHTLWFLYVSFFIKYLRWLVGANGGFVTFYFPSHTGWIRNVLLPFTHWVDAWCLTSLHTGWMIDISLPFTHRGCMTPYLDLPVLILPCTYKIEVWRHTAHPLRQRFYQLSQRSHYLNRKVRDFS